MAKNSMTGPYDETKNEERADLEHDALYLGMSKEDFAVHVDRQISRAEKYWKGKKLEQRQKLNIKYWEGDQVDKAALRDDLEKHVENAIFRNLETFIPIATARTPELSVTAAYKNQATREFTMDVQRALTSEWEVKQNMRQRLGGLIRNHNLLFLGVIKMGVDEVNGRPKFWSEEIRADEITVSKDGSFIAHHIKDETLREVIEKFPDSKSEIKQALGLPQRLSIPKSMLDSPFEYIEAWTDELVGWKMQDHVFDLQRNPHYDYEGREFELPTGQVYADEFGNPVEEVEIQTVQYNYFDRPKKPFLYLYYWNRGIHVFDDTTIVEQSIGLQDWINKRKRQIGMNADSTNGHWVSSGDFISKEEFQKIQGGVDEKIWLENGRPEDGLKKITGEALPDFVFSDLQDSRGALDNVMGMHATTRGEESGAKTATQDIMQKDQDYGRVDGYIRDGIELFAQRWYEWLYHLHLVYMVEEVSIPIPEEDDFEQDNVVFSRDKVPVIKMNDGTLDTLPLVFQVKQGSTLPKDDVAEFEKAKQMKDVLSPFDYLKKMGEPNPRKLTKNLLLWQMDPTMFFQEDQEVMAAVQSAQQRMLMQQQVENQANPNAQQPEAGGGASQPGQAPAGMMQQSMGGNMNAPAPIDQSRPSGNGVSDQGVANALRAELENMAGASVQ